SAARELDHVEHVGPTRYDRAGHVAVVAARPGPLAPPASPAPVVLYLAGRIAARLGDPVEPGSGVRQRGPVAEGVAHDVGARARIGQPVAAVGVEREVQA